MRSISTDKRPIPGPGDFVDDSVASELGDGSGCAREFIQAQDRRRLRDLLLHGAASAPAGVADSRYFESLRARLRNGGR